MTSCSATVYQHRGQFSVYLRMLDVAVPASWGPSGDEPPGFHAKGSIGLAGRRSGGTYVSCMHSDNGNADRVGSVGWRSDCCVGEQTFREKNLTKHV